MAHRCSDNQGPTVYVLCMYYTYTDKPVVKITGVTIGCGYVNISLNTTGNIDECSVQFYNSTLSYITMSKRVTVSKTSRVTSLMSTITGLPDDMQMNINVTGIHANRDIINFDTTSVRTKHFKCMYKFTAF